LLRIAAVIALLFAAGHATGGRQDWSPMGDTEVLKAMRAVRFEVMGVSRSYLDFYRGFGHGLTVAMLLQAVLLFQLSSVAKADPGPARPMIAAFTLASAANGLVAWLFLFPIPAVFSVVLTLVLGMAFVVAG
jgi:hypothetical protein